jgi:hypothetical protein
VRAGAAMAHDPEEHLESLERKVDPIDSLTSGLRARGTDLGISCAGLEPGHSSATHVSDVRLVL